LSSVEELIRKHEAFEKTLTAQLVKVEELEKYALNLVTGQHYDSNGIQGRLVSICNRRDRLKEATASRKKRLNDSRLLQQFLRNMYEVNKIEQLYERQYYMNKRFFNIYNFRWKDG